MTNEQAQLQLLANLQKIKAGKNQQKGSDDARGSCCMKPKLGSVVRYTELGKGAYYQLHGCWPPSNGTLGIVIEYSASKNSCAVQRADLQTEFFVWRFADGLNTHFTWTGKHDN